MRVLLDTCVVLDLLQKRIPFYKESKGIFLGIANNQIEGFVSANTLTDIHYIMYRYTHSEDMSRKALETLLQLVNVVSTTGADCQMALASKVKDYEDAVMIETAVREDMDYIITRDLSDYKQSSIPVLSPENFLQRHVITD